MYKSIMYMAVAGCLLIAPARSGELYTLYQKALANDPRYAGALAQRAAAEENVPLARSAMLPQLALNGSLSERWTSIESPRFGGGKVQREFAYSPRNYSATIVQSLYDQGNWESYWQAEWMVKRADAFAARSLDDLKLRLLSAYLLMQRAGASLELIAKQKEVYAAMLQQAERSYAAGYGTITEIAESKSRQDELLAEELAAKAAFDNRLSELRRIVGDATFSPALLHVPAFAPDMHLGKPLSEWQSLAKNASPYLAEQQAKVKVAEYQLGKMQADYLPSLQLRLQYSADRNSDYASKDVTEENAQAVVSLNIPIFEGGRTLAQSRQAASQLLATREELRGSLDEVGLNIEKEYGNAVAQGARVIALERSVDTNKLLVKATQKSVQAGVRTTVDVLNAENQLFEASLKLASARIDYLQSLTNLRVAAGLLPEEDLQRLDELFSSLPLVGGQ